MSKFFNYFKHQRNIGFKEKYFSIINNIAKNKKNFPKIMMITHDYICHDCGQIVRYPYFEHFYDCKNDAPNTNIITYFLSNCSNQLDETKRPTNSTQTEPNAKPVSKLSTSRHSQTSLFG